MILILYGDINQIKLLKIFKNPSFKARFSAPRHRPVYLQKAFVAISSCGSITILR